MTRQRSTFTGAQLERALQKEIYAPRGAGEGEKRSVELARAQFADKKILDHADCIHLAQRARRRRPPATPPAAVLEAEGYVPPKVWPPTRRHGLTERTAFCYAQRRAACRHQPRAGPCLPSCDRRGRTSDHRRPRRHRQKPHHRRRPRSLRGGRLSRHRHSPGRNKVVQDMEAERLRARQHRQTRIVHARRTAASNGTAKPSSSSTRPRCSTPRTWR